MFNCSEQLLWVTYFSQRVNGRPAGLGSNLSSQPGVSELSLATRVFLSFSFLAVESAIKFMLAQQ